MFNELISKAMIKLLDVSKGECILSKYAFIADWKQEIPGKPIKQEHGNNSE